MLYKKLAFFLFIGAFVLSGCAAEINGGGKVALSSVETGLGSGVAPTLASIAVNVNCNDNKKMFRGNINFHDKANGVKFTAHLPWTEFDEVLDGLGSGGFDTCAEANELADMLSITVAQGIIRHKGDKNSGTASVTLSQPGANTADCGDMQVVQINATGSSDVLPGGSYDAEGCLERGSIKFK